MHERESNFISTVCETARTYLIPERTAVPFRSGRVAADSGISPALARTLSAARPRPPVAARAPASQMGGSCYSMEMGHDVT
eukprot:6036921-Prymnesium_polylepis.1